MTGSQPNTEQRLCLFVHRDGDMQLGCILNADKVYHTWPFKLRLGGREWLLANHGSGGRWSIPTYRQVELERGNA